MLGKTASLKKIGIIEKMVLKQHIDSLIPGCKDLLLISKESGNVGFPILNTTKIHTDAIVIFCFELAQKLRL